MTHRERMVCTAAGRAWMALHGLSPADFLYFGNGFPIVMKLGHRYWLYSLECVPTGMIYIGLTGKPNPCWRWSEHYVSLRNGISKCTLLQKAWNDFPDLTKWRFMAISVVYGLVNGRHCEAELILAVPDDKRLNSKTMSTVSLERRKAVAKMLRDGCKYRQISNDTGLSVGTISKIKRLQNGLVSLPP